MHLLVANQIARTLRLTFSLVKDIPESTLVSIGSRLVARRDRPLARRHDAARQPQQGARTQPSKNPAPVRVDHCGRFASRFWAAFAAPSALRRSRSEEHTSELQSLMRISYAVFCLKIKKNTTLHQTEHEDEET